MEKDFVNIEQRLFWYAFSGKCGPEFMGNPSLMEGFIEMEREREKEKDRGLEK